MGRIIGAVLVITACSAMGLSMSRRISGRYRELVEWKRILGLIEGRIRFGGGTLREIFTELAEKEGAPYDRFFAHTAAAMEQGTGIRLSEHWSSALKAELSDAWLSPDDLAFLDRLGRDLGELDKVAQLQTLAFAKQQLEERRQELLRELPVKRRLYGCLGVLSGLFLTILLI